MENSLAKTSKVVTAGADDVEKIRRALNGSYSEAPADLGEVFRAALDQVADQQVRVAEALTRLLTTGELAQAETDISTAVMEAQRTAMRAARAFADYEFECAKPIYGVLTHIPTNTVELVTKKRSLDDEFARAVKLHEEDNAAALELLLGVSARYNDWCSEGQLLIAGSEGIVASDRRRTRLQYAAILIALVLGILNLIFNLLKLHK